MIDSFGMSGDIIICWTQVRWEEKTVRLEDKILYLFVFNSLEIIYIYIYIELCFDIFDYIVRLKV